MDTHCFCNELVIRANWSAGLHGRRRSPCGRPVPPLRANRARYWLGAGCTACLAMPLAIIPWPDGLSGLQTFASNIFDCKGSRHRAVGSHGCWGLNRARQAPANGSWSGQGKSAGGLGGDEPPEGPGCSRRTGSAGNGQEGLWYRGRPAWGPPTRTRCATRPGCQSRSTMVTLAMPPPSHMVCSP